MKSGLRILGVLIILASTSIGGFSPNASTARAGEPDIREGGETWLAPKVGTEYVPDEIVVRFRAGVPQQAVERINRFLDVAEVKVAVRSGLYSVRIRPGSSVDDVLALYRAQAEVAAATRHAIVRLFTAPDDPYYTLQWHLANPASGWGGIDWQAVWDRPAQPKGNGVPVAIIDSGVAWNNPNATDLKGYTNFLILNGSDLVNNDSDPNDDNGHGTHVAGTVAQATNNGVGVAGVASGATIVPIKVIDNTGNGELVNLIEAIYMAIGATASGPNLCAFDSTPPPAQVINMSVGFPVGTALADLPGLPEALECALARDVVVVAAAGNDGSTTDVAYPAKYPTVIAVGATTIDKKYTWYSNQGTDVDIVAPGGDDCSGASQWTCILLGINPDKNGDGYADGVLQQTFAIGSDPANPANWKYYFLAGTSMASPHVAGVVALVRGVNPALNASDVRTVLEQTGSKLGLPPDDPGLVDAAASVQRAVELLGGSNNSPVASAGVDRTSIEGQSLTFDGSGSYDADGSIVSYSWQFGDGATGSGVSASHVYAENGSYQVALTVVDNQGATGTDTATVTVNNVPPTAEAGGPYSGSVGQPIRFIGTATDPGTADTLAFIWHFGDGNSTTGATASHAYTSPGSYIATLEVRDDDGGVGTDTASVTVSPSATTAYVSIVMSQELSPKRWRASAAVTIRNANASGAYIVGATVRGQWSGAYTKGVSGVTDGNGHVAFSTPSIGGTETATFTVISTEKDGRSYDLSGLISASIAR